MWHSGNANEIKTHLRGRDLVIIKSQKIMEKLENVHPGEILFYEFLDLLGISAYLLSKDLKIPQTLISLAIKGRHRITADTALRLSKYFGYSAKFFLDFKMILTSKRKKKTNHLNKTK